MPPLIAQDGIPITDDSDKETMLNKHFADQARLDTQNKLMPTITPPDSSVPSLAEVQVTELQVLNPRPDEVWRVTRPDEVVAQSAPPPSVSSKVRVVE